ncbi:MAG TPA: polysaccharide deacetylase family protein [Bacteroidota bacterium]|nr:polysaccharide deacetylase family protein [Bacteroidota bacterium]
MKQRIAGTYHSAVTTLVSRLPMLLPGTLHRLSDTHAVAVTIDDGPTPRGTPSVLRTLEMLKMRATFFLTGDEVLRHPGLVRDIVALGHTVASHGHRHEDRSFARANTVREDVLRSLDAIEHCTGVRPRWYRPPFGRVNPLHIPVIRAEGCSVVLWSRMPREFASAVTGGSILACIRDVQGGDILVLHDNARSRDSVPLLLAAVARAMKEKDLLPYQFANVERA